MNVLAERIYSVYEQFINWVKSQGLQFPYCLEGKPENMAGLVRRYLDWKCPGATSDVRTKAENDLFAALSILAKFMKDNDGYFIPGSDYIQFPNGPPKQ